MATMTVKDDMFFIRAGNFYRHWELTTHGAITRGLKVGEWSVPLRIPEPSVPECYYDGLLRQAMHRTHPDYPCLKLKTAGIVKSGCGPIFEGGHQSLTFVWEEQGQGTVLARSWRVYSDAAAIVTFAEISSESAPQLEFGRHDYLNVVDTLPVDLAGWDLCAVSLWGRSDGNNDLVRHERRRVGRMEDAMPLRGNLLFLEPPGGGCGLFILVESPPLDERRPENGADFLIGPTGIQIVGWGLSPAEIMPDRRRRSYSVAVGGYVGGEVAKLHAVRKFLKARYPPVPDMQTIVANPWGDGKCRAHLNEAFVLKELEACAAMGVTHYQIDDGWQAGDIADVWIHNAARSASFWNIHPRKFPSGFSPLVERGKALGIKLALWFAPDGNRHYRNWREERDILLDFHRKYGIDLFKIDGVLLRTKEAEESLTCLLESVHCQSGGLIHFNPDITAGQRHGPVVMLRYGNLFMENRYVRKGQSHLANTYIPWRALRNLWNISRYMPPERIQMEIPNCRQFCFNSTEEIAEAFEMKTFRDDYPAALALMASPLCWFEPSTLPAVTLAGVGRVLNLHRQVSAELAQGHTFPVGEEPNGRAWTGFQTIIPARNEGLLLAFRENTSLDRFGFDLSCSIDAGPLSLECLSHPGPQVRAASAHEVVLHIPEPNDFRLYRYGLVRRLNKLSG